MRRKIMGTMVAAVSIMMLAGCGQTPEDVTTESTVAMTETIMTVSESAGAVGVDGSKDLKPNAVLKAPEGYPSKNISWIVPADAGAPMDIPVRAIVENMEVDTNIIVENIAGASNTIGALEAKNRPADGYTIVGGSSSSLILQPLMVDLAYSPDDFRIIALPIPLCTYAIVVSPKSPLKSADDWVDFVKAGNRFTFTVSNAGNASHLSILDALGQMKVESGVFVPYNGGAEVTAALLNQEVDFAVLDTPAQLQRAAKGDMNVLLIMSDKPDPLSPQTPVIGTYGITGMDAYFSLQCVAVRKDTPDEIVEYLKQQINAAIETEAYKKYLKESGVGEMSVMSEKDIELKIEKARETYKTILEKTEMIKK